MLRIWKSFWAEVLTPSGPDESAYLWAVIAIGHAMLGGTLVAVLDLVLPWIVVALAVPVAYWCIKEMPDIRRGGNPWDGLADTAFVGLGAFHGVAAWPVLVLVLVGASMALRGLVRGQT